MHWRRNFALLTITHYLYFYRFFNEYNLCQSTLSTDFRIWGGHARMIRLYFFFFFLVFFELRFSKKTKNTRVNRCDAHCLEHRAISKYGVRSPKSNPGHNFGRFILGQKRLYLHLGFARAVVGSISKIGFFDHLNFGKYEPGHLYVGPFSAKIFLKIRVCKIDPSVKEGCGKGSLFAFLEAARAVVGSICRIGQVLARQRVMFDLRREGERL